jgi:hypothetical protein
VRPAAGRDQEKGRGEEREKGRKGRCELT